MTSDGLAVDWSNPGDIIHYYNNPDKYPNATEMLSRIPTDMYIAATCINIVESKVLGILETGADSEIEFLRSKLQEGSGANADSGEIPGGNANEEIPGANDADANNGNGWNADSQVITNIDTTGNNNIDTTGNNNIDTTGNNNIDTAGNNNIDVAGDKELARGNGSRKVVGDIKNDFYIKNLGKLLKPFVVFYFKNIANLVIYVKKRTGVDFTEILFDIPVGSPENIIEWYLIMSYLSKERDFDMKDIKRVLELNPGSNLDEEDYKNSHNRDDIESEENTGFGKKSSELDFFENENLKLSASSGGGHASMGSQLSLAVGGKISEIGSPPINTTEIQERGKPFEANSVSNLWLCLEKTKKEIFLYPKKDEKFYSRALATFLSIKFDREVFREFIGNRNAYFCESLSVFKNPPFFFFRDANIQRLLYDPCRYPERVMEWIESDEVRTKTLLHCNSYTLEYFLSYSNDVFGCINSFRKDWIVVAFGFIQFARKYASDRLFSVFLKLKECRIEGACTEIALIFMENVLLLMERYYNDNNGEMENTDAEMGNNNGEMDNNNGEMGNNDNKRNTDVEMGNPDINGFHEDVPMPSLDKNIPMPSLDRDVPMPSLEDPESSLVNAFNNPHIYDDLDNRRANKLFEGLPAVKNRRRVLEEFVLEKSREPQHQKFILRNLKILEMFPLELSQRIVKNLIEKEGFEWRLSKMIIENREILMNYGLSMERLMAYKNSKIKYIREMASQIEN